MAKKRNLRKLIFQALDSAVENGYVEDFEGCGKTIYEAPIEDVANSLADYSSDIQDVLPELSEVDIEDLGSVALQRSVDLLGPHILKWQKSRHTQSI